MDWTRDRIQTLTKPEVKQLRANAERLDEPGVVALCDEVLSSKAVKPAKPAGSAKPRKAKAAKPRKEGNGD